MKVGVLALQGAFAAHRRVLETLGHQVIEVRSAGELAESEALVLPGGESTTQLKLIDVLGLEQALRDYLDAGNRSVLATCAGLILLAKEVEHPAQKSFGALDITVARNAWGRQQDSFQAEADTTKTPLVFIRAPRITRTGDTIEVLEKYAGEPVLIRQRNITAASFHPELTENTEVHAAALAR